MTRMTHTTVMVLDAFKKQPGTELAGTELLDSTTLSAGTLYPILRRLEKAGLLSSRWEDIDPRKEGRPRRRYYRLEGMGARMLAEYYIKAPRKFSAGALASNGGIAHVLSRNDFT